jgi:hypothetical protein
MARFQPLLELKRLETFSFVDQNIRSATNHDNNNISFFPIVPIQETLNSSCPLGSLSVIGTGRSVHGNRLVDKTGCLKP